MGVLLMADASTVHPDVAAAVPSCRSRPPPPKKKWIRHYLLEEEPLEATNNRANGNLHHLQQQQTLIRASPAIGSPPSANFVVASATIQQHQPQQSVPQEAQLNHYLDNQKTGGGAGGTLIADVEGVHSDSKKPRNGPCVIRSGTREVHNKLEKNRRAHLKECFELLKKQLPSQDEKKSSNLSILHAAIRHIQALRKKERDFEHEMERLAREKITAQQKLVSLKKEFSNWDHLDLGAMISDHNSSLESNQLKSACESMEVDSPSGGLARTGTRYSSTSSLGSATTASSPQHHQSQASNGNHNSNSNGASSNIQSQMATAAVVCQTQGLNLAHNSRDSPPTSSSPGASTPSIPTPAQEKVTITPTLVQPSQAQSAPQSQQPTQLHLPISAQMLNTSQGLATIVPALQHLGQGLRVIPGDGRQLIAVQSNGTVTTGANGEARPVALVVHSTEANSDNRVTFVHSTGAESRQLALAVQSSGNEVRPIVLTTPALNVTSATNRLRTGDAAQTTHKMIGGIASVGSPGCELARLPGGAELNILPANGQIFRSVKAPIAVQGGLTLSHAGVSIQTTTKPSTAAQTTNVQQQQQQSGSNGTSPSLGQHEGIAASCHLVAPGHQSLAGLTSIVGPMAAVVSQGNTQGQTMIIASPSLAGKMISTNILKNVAPITVNAQYLNNLVKPVMVVSANHQQSQQQPQTTSANSTAAVSSQSAV
ncbi:uncharacterized protein LOC131668985 isoform X2 [Phymastichus coffea]|uniref:uncharacterized protein LOC131668985 isoform X2 n=1 Tax=Phymastichus coffea TaxID=108790 RepID=UPI00273B3977|nr:uncharacterized protein LOC131668985 isoform X2 [Phymastichus coffea]